MESEKVRLNYSYSAPSTGLAGRRTAGDEHELRPRSNLFLPLKARVTPEALKLKQEAEKIIQSVQENHYRDRDSAMPEPSVVFETQDLKLKKLSRHFPAFPEITFLSEDSDTDSFSPEKKASYFKSYKYFKAFKTPEKRPLPEELKSPYMSMEKCEESWDWLNDYERITEFTFFMEVVD